MDPKNEQKYMALAMLLNLESTIKLREKLVRILSCHRELDKDLTEIEAVAMKDLFDVGVEEILKIKEILERK